MKQLEVKILGQSYLLGCPDGGEQRMVEAVQRVDSAMCAIRDAGKIKARDRIAVLAALNLAFEHTEPPAAVQAADPTEGASLPANAQLAAILVQLDAALGDDGQLL
ncbi:MAG TPA: cell division protein ZapA [Pseudorhodoferax sp.]|nr:cell division protein ZapA [Pseudorhodoferax sp.]